MLRLGAEVTCGGRLFQTFAPETGNTRLPIEERVLGTMKRSDDAERKPGRPAWESRTKPCRYDGGRPFIDRYAKTATLKRMRSAPRNQCNDTSVSVTCSDRWMLKTSLAAAFCTTWRRCTETAMPSYDELMTNLLYALLRTLIKSM
jgi:hypothetical protein